MPLPIDHFVRPDLPKKTPVSKHGTETLPKVGAGSIAAATRVKRGWLCGFNVGGYLVPFTAVPDLVSAGIAEVDLDNRTGGNGGPAGYGLVPLAQQVAEVAFAGGGDALTDADAPCAVYGIDHETVGKSDGGATPRSIVGLFVGLNPENGRALVWVGRVAHAVALARAYGGSHRTQRGTVTLVDGVGTVNTGITLTASSRIVTQMNTPGGTLGTWGYKVPTADRVVGAPGTAAFIVRAIDADKVAAVLDTSTLDYIIEG